MENTIQVTLSKESIEKLMEVSNFDYNIYNTGIKITDEQMSNIDIEPIGEFPQWNYRIRGFKRSI